MRKILITGSDGSLGSRLMHVALQYDWEPVGLPMSRVTNGIMVGMPHCEAIINCHGINKLMPLGESDPGEVEKILHFNVAAPYMIVNDAVRCGWEPARVLNIASQTYRIPQRMTGAYCASKAALVQLTRVMARELAPHGWVINALCPGKIADTEMARKTDAQVCKLRGWTEQEASRYALANIPMRRYTSRQEVADACFQILDLPNYINGAIIDMTGGA